MHTTKRGHPLTEPLKTDPSSPTLKDGSAQAAYPLPKNKEETHNGSYL